MTRDNNKRMKKSPIDMPMLMYLCDEMAKSGDECFFTALGKLGILPAVLANRSQYYKDFAVTAREHGHNQLATTLATSPRYITTINLAVSLNVVPSMFCVLVDLPFVPYTTIFSLIFYSGNYCDVSYFLGRYRVTLQ